MLEKQKIRLLTSFTLWIVLTTLLYCILLAQSSCGSCNESLHLANNPENEISYESEDNVNDVSTKKNAIKLSNHEASSKEENFNIENFKRTNPDLYNVINAFKSVLEESDEESEILKAAYLEVRNVSINRKSLQNGWFKYNQDMQNGFKTAELLKVVSNSDKFLEKHNDMALVVDRIFRFESNFKHEYKNFLDGKFSNEKLKMSLRDFGVYLESILMLDTMLKTKRDDGRLRYVQGPELNKSNKLFISQNSTTLLSNRIEKLVHSLDECIGSYKNYLSKFATITNILNQRSDLNTLSNIIGATIDPRKDSLDYVTLLYGGKIIPGSILATWINSNSLLDGSWDNLLWQPNRDASVVNILYDIDELTNLYSGLLYKMEKNFTNTDTNSHMHEGIRDMFVNIKSDKNFMTVHEKGKRAIVLARKILSEEKKFDIGRSHPTLGLRYVGKWRTDDSSKQIFESDAVKLIDGLDFLSAIAVLIDSNATLRLPLYPNRIARYLRNISKINNNLASNNEINDRLWIFESIEEQSTRENNTRAKYSLLVAQLIVTLCITAVFPFLMPLTISLFVIECAIALGVQSEII